jgi:hypothetical protein
MEKRDQEKGTEVSDLIQNDDMEEGGKDWGVTKKPYQKPELQIFAPLRDITGVCSAGHFTEPPGPCRRRR